MLKLLYINGICFCVNGNFLICSSVGVTRFNKGNRHLQVDLSVAGVTQRERTKIVLL